MFTGIVEALGKVVELRRAGEGALLTLEAPFEDVKEGDSVAVNGVCLTLTARKGGLLTFELSQETLRKTNLSRLKAGERVNLERALRLSDRLGGHLLLGHVDFTAPIRSFRPLGRHRELKVAVPPEKRKFFVEKGSVGLDGISLTVNEVGRDFITVNVIPYTYEHTNLKFRKVGDLLNVELDIFGKYAVNYLESLGRSFL